MNFFRKHKKIWIFITMLATISIILGSVLPLIF